MFANLRADRARLREAAVDLDIALVTHADIRAAVAKGATTMRGTVLLKPRDVDRVTRHVMAALERPVDYWPTDEQPTGEIGHVDAIRRGHLTADQRRDGGAW